MRTTAIVILFAACGAPAVPTTPDASTDAGPPDASPYVRCMGWEIVFPSVTMCVPKCADFTALGQWQANTCAYASGKFCNPLYMTAMRGTPGAGCCVHERTPAEVVNFYPCLQ